MGGRDAVGRGLLDRVEAATPDGRDRGVDLVRAAALVAVVLGHWFVIAVSADADGRPTGVNALDTVAWTHPLTWLFQVMPLIFAAGGYANSASWAAASRRRTPTGDWMIARLRRLLLPAGVLVLVLVGAGAALLAIGVDAQIVRDAVWISGVALWFLAVYLVVTVSTPWACRLDERWGIRVVVGAMAAVLVLDLLRVALGAPWGWATYLLAWWVLHQAGVRWFRHGVRDSDARRIAVAGIGTALVLVALGPWPLALVASPDDGVSNTAPPSFVLVCFGLGAWAIAVLVARRLDATLHRRRVWAVVAGINLSAMTIYLWHLVPVAVLAPLVARAVSTGVLPDPAVGSGGWIALRPLWLLACTAVLVGIVLLVLPVERAAARAAAQAGPTLVGRSVPTAVLLTLLATTGLLVVTIAGALEPGHPVSWSSAGVLLVLAVCVALLPRRRRESADAAVSPARPGARPRSGAGTTASTEGRTARTAADP